MKILTLLGSPRKKGNTAAVLSAFERLAAREYAIERVNIVDQDIHGCLGCDRCQRDINRPACIQKDGLNDLLKKIILADLVVYAAPVYVWDFPAQMKALMDRQYCLVKWLHAGDKSLVENKKTMLLTTCGGDAENNADLIRLVFEREMKYLQCQVMGEFIVPNCTTPTELRSRKDETALQMNDVVHCFKRDA